MNYYKCIGSDGGGGSYNRICWETMIKNTDGNSSANIECVNPYQSAITTANFLLDLKAFQFSGSNSYTSNTSFNSYSSNTLNVKWTTQSGSSCQYFGILAVEDVSQIKVLSDWTRYNTNAVNEYIIPSEALHLSVNDFIIDFRNVMSGGKTISLAYVTKSIQNGKLKVIFPFPSTASSVSIEARILYVV